MKRLVVRTFACLLFSALIADGLQGTTMLPFPALQDGSDTMSLDAASAVVERLEEKIGHYPPRLSGDQERLEVFAEWARAFRAVEKAKADGVWSETAAVLLARLYRQGHNLDVSECGERGFEVIGKGLRDFPDSVPMHLHASYFYLQIPPEHGAALGEKLLLRLRVLLKSDKDWEVERGLVFAYVYQKKVKEAKKQVAHCLKLRPNDPMMLKFREALKNGPIQTRAE